MPYAEQLAAKDARVASLYAQFDGAQLRPVLGMRDPFHYRNKVTSPFAPGKRVAGKREAGKRAAGGGHEVLSGMYAAGSHRIVQTDGCLLENERAQQVVRAVKRIMERHRIAPYDERRHAGFMRHVVVRVGHESGEVLVTLVTNGEAFPNSKSFARELRERCPFITTIVQNVNTRQTNVILGQEERRLFGPGFILDTLCGLSFRISSRSFYQVNAQQTAVLYEQATQLAALDPGQVAIDAYCGTGTIGLVAAKRGAGSVIGVDSVEAAIRDARENARHNGVSNARFVARDAADFMRELAAEAGAGDAAGAGVGADAVVGDACGCSASGGGSSSGATSGGLHPGASGGAIDVVFLDPPRAGASPAFLEALCALAPARVVYVSCNPDTHVRDLQFLSQRGYRVSVVQPVDMFPHTDHLECIALLERSSVR